jgi:hypothetical protein
MATAETVELGAPHKPKEESIKAFSEIEVELKKTLQHLRHDMTKHEPAYFAAVQNLSDKQLTNFSAEDLVLVRVATSAYGLHLFGKVLLPDSDGHTFPPHSGAAYFHFRAFIAGQTVKLHCIHTEELETNGNRTFKAIFSQSDPLEWFDT